MKQQNNYLPDFLIIPAALIKDKRLHPLDLLTYGVIYWYTRLKLEKCIASNGTIGELLSAHQNSVANSISRLNKYGYVRVLYDETLSSMNRVRKEIIPLYVMEGVTPNGEGGLRRLIKQVTPFDETGVTPFDEHNNNTNKKENTKIPGQSANPLITEYSEQASPAPHSKRLQGKTYSSIDYLTGLSAEELKWFIDRFPSLSSDAIKKYGEDAYYWLKSKGKLYKDYQSFLRNWIANDLKRAQSTNKRRVASADEYR